MGKRYLRIGDPPASERSFNNATGETELGVSVYELHHKTGEPIIPEEGEWAHEDFHARMKGDEPKHIVEGDEVGWGHDGETLLRNVRIMGLFNDRRTK